MQIVKLGKNHLYRVWFAGLKIKLKSFVINVILGDIVTEKKEHVIPEVIEAYKILAKYSFDEKITPEDKSRTSELLSKVPKVFHKYDKLQVAVAAINVSGEGRTAARALKDYMINCGMDPGKIMDLHVESMRSSGGHGAECWG